MLGKETGHKILQLFKRDKVILFRVATFKSENTHGPWSQGYIGGSSEKISDGQTRFNL